VLSVALLIGDSKRIPLIMLPSVACTIPQYFSTLSRKRLSFRGVGGGLELLDTIVCFDFCTNLSENFLFPSRIQRDMIVKVADIDSNDEADSGFSQFC